MAEEKAVHPLAEMDISVEVQKAFTAMGFRELTPIQARCIPMMMQGHDVIAIAPTGTGKTLGFGIPMLEYVNLRDDRVQEVVLAPTRELAQQIAEELRNLARFIPEVRIAIIYGGQPISKQITALKRRPQILVATPGRLLDHMQRGNISLSCVHTLVLDEADEMLKMGFVKDVCRIIESTQPDRELVMFSATTNQDVMTISWKYQQEPVEIVVEATRENRPQISQYVIESTRQDKYDHLLYLLDSDHYKRAMIFCNTKDMTDRLCMRLQKAGYSAECLHGDIRQSQRDKVMTGFRKGRFEFLVATDIAARGIDVDDVEAVFNYDLPEKDEYYVHRIGRTGRAKKKGVSFSFIDFRESVRLDEIMKYVHSKPTMLGFDEYGTLCYKESGEPFFEDM
ncbi:DEAD/DEAH box helicase [Beduinella massiliensis]|uniref:DEAD/DEAH box helicase n=1 Tax=Beduinella massiliensis TaxID=1852363 RepID=UPI0031F763CF